MASHGSRSTESEACENSDDGNDGKELNQGERVIRTIFVLVE